VLSATGVAGGLVRIPDRRDLRVGTQQFLVLDITLEVGGIEESITVSGQSPLIETANASI